MNKNLSVSFRHTHCLGNSIDSNSIVSGFDDHIRMPVPKRPFVFYKEIQNFTVVPKRRFVFLKQNTKF